MSYTRSGVNLNIIFLSLYKFILKRIKHSQTKTYDYTQYVSGRDYVFELADNQAKGYMTGQGKGIKRGDYIILYNGSKSCRYQVEEIDYYSEPPDMWIALLDDISSQ